MITIQPELQASFTEIKVQRDTIGLNAAQIDILSNNGTTQILLSADEAKALAHAILAIAERLK
jgi:hypothetical protein